MTHDTLPPTGDRRQNAKLRTRFDEAYARILPFFDPAYNWGGASLQHFAFRTLREAYPDLSPLEVHQLVAAAARVYLSRNPGRTAHLPPAEAFTPPERL